MRWASRWIPGRGEVWEAIPGTRIARVSARKPRNPKPNELRVDEERNALIRWDGTKWQGLIEAPY